MTKKQPLNERTQQTCVICGIPFTGWGHNPEPVKKFEEGRACSDCNSMKVIPARITRMVQAKAEEGT